MTQIPLPLSSKSQSQRERLWLVLQDGKPHRSDSLVAQVYGPGLSLARLAARVFDVKDRYGVEIKGWKDKTNPVLYYYQLIGKKEQA